jgi:NitT/TauT family transport system ATP-binding protein
MIQSNETNKNFIESQNVLNISNLFFTYKSNEIPNKVIQNLSLSIKAGEIVTILGASGCGKSTLLNLIAGLLVPVQGSIQFNYNQIQIQSKQQIAYIFQDDALLPWRTVESNLLLAYELNQELKKEESKEKILDYLNLFHLVKNVLKLFPTQLSGGMRQRISIIQALMFNPQIILLDEPFSALDFFTKLRLESELYQFIKTKNKSAILITHDIDEAIAISDRVMLMASGGAITNEFAIDFGNAVRSPEEVRGTAKFADYYHRIWSQLRKVIQE